MILYKLSVILGGLMFGIGLALIYDIVTPLGIFLGILGFVIFMYGIVGASWNVLKSNNKY